MIFSAKCEYAMRAMIGLAEAADGVPVQSRVVAARQGIPEGFLEQIMLDLRRAGLIQSIRGARGGYRLSRTPAEISVADVVQAIDGPLQTGAAWHGVHEDQGPTIMVMGEVWANVRGAIVEVLSTMDLGQLAEITRRAGATAPPA